MSTNEGHPSGLNPEWETNRGKNIAAVKKIHGFFFHNPHIANSITKLEKHDSVTIEDWIKGRVNVESLSGLEQILAQQKELIVGHEMDLRHGDKGNSFYLAVGYDGGYREIKKYTTILPEGFNFPVYLISQSPLLNLENAVPMTVSSPYGEVQRDLIGVNGLWYHLINYYCFNFSGQGVKIESIVEMSKIEGEFDDTDELDEAIWQPTKVDFIPKEDHSRVAPLTPEDYQKINSMFEQIDVGEYKFRA